MSDELEQYASASPRRRRVIRAANAAKSAQSAGFQAIGYSRNPLSNMPRGGQQSPHGDLGILRQREGAKLAKWVDRPGNPVAASKELSRKPQRGPDSARVSPHSK